MDRCTEIHGDFPEIWKYKVHVGNGGELRLKWKSDAFYIIFQCKQLKKYFIS